MSALDSPYFDHHFIGNKQSLTLLYLKTPMPNYPETQFTGDWLNEFIRLNGNHWRKILVIYAKLMAPSDNWRDYLYHGYLLDECAISFNADYGESAQVHLIAGKQNWHRFHYDAPYKPNTFYQRGACYLVPYPDYRQFPNALITQLRAALSRSN